MGLKLYYSPYTLCFPEKSNAQSGLEQQGYLLKLEDHNGNLGYGSFQVWTELGDDALKIQINNWDKGILSPQLSRGLQWAKWDLDGKEKKSSLVRTYSQLNSSQCVKLKIGMNQSEEVKQLEKLKANSLILDANNSLDFDGASRFWSSLPQSIKDKILYVEDFIPYEEDSWKHLSLMGTKLAWDFQDQSLDAVNHDHIDYIIHKPARADWRSLVKYQKPLIFTHYMDHIVGIQAARYEALLYQERYPNIFYHGLEVHAGISQNMPRFHECAVPGWGIANELAAQPWKYWMEFDDNTL